MRKVYLNMKEQLHFDVIRDLANNRLSKQHAATKLNLTIRTINRKLYYYNKRGKESFSHNNKDRKPATTISNKQKSIIINLYKDKYFDLNFIHFKEKLNEIEEINVSISFIRSLMKQNDILSPNAHRLTKRNHLKKIKQQALLNEQVINEVDNITNQEVDYQLLTFGKAHPRRPRAKYMGELLQMDASNHVWFGKTKTHLHAAIDDATGLIVGAYFTTQETLEGYYNVMYQILNKYGIPYEILTDKRTVFEYKKKNAPSIEKDTFTQFGYACHQLGTTITTSSIPQAKGRIERLFSTLQSRLVSELRLAGVATTFEANNFLEKYVEVFNHQFALQDYNNTSKFDIVENFEDLNLILSVLSNRKIDNGSNISYKGKYYYPVDDKYNIVCLPPKAKVLVIDTFDHQMYLSVNETIYELVLLEDNNKYSKEFDLQLQKKRAKAGKFTPAMSHPWKPKSFMKHLAKQKHISTDEIVQM